MERVLCNIIACKYNCLLGKPEQLYRGPGYVPIGNANAYSGICGKNEIEVRVTENESGDGGYHYIPECLSFETLNDS